MDGLTQLRADKPKEKGENGKGWRVNAEGKSKKSKSKRMIESHLVRERITVHLVACGTGVLYKARLVDVSILDNRMRHQ